MTAALTWLAFLVLVVAAYLAALNMALSSASRLALVRRMEERGRPEAGQWVANRLDAAIGVTALVRTAFRIAFFALVLVDIAGLGQPITLGTLVWAGVLSVLLLWLVTSVLSAAIARYAGVGIIHYSVGFLRVLTILGIPLRWIGSIVDESVKRLAGANIPREEEIEADLLRSIEETHLKGGLDEDAAALLENVVEFGSTDVGEVMTPRTDIDGIELTDNLSDIRKLIIEAGHSRIPVYSENLDNIIGILIVKDLIPYLGEAVPPDFRLEPLLRKPIVVPETKPVRELLTDFQKSEVHMAIVIDEYGGTAGLVTIEDVLEEIVGEIHDEHEPGDDDEPTLAKLTDGRAEVDGRFRIDEINEELNLELPEEEEYDTIAGFLLAKFGRVPEANETLETHGARFIILDATPTHIRRIGIELLEPAAVNGRDELNSGK